MQTTNWGGFFPYWKSDIKPSHAVTTKMYPESFFQFPLPILIVMTLSSVFKIVTPFALEHLYTTMAPSNFALPFCCFLTVIGGSYWFER